MHFVGGIKIFSRFEFLSSHEHFWHLAETHIRFDYVTAVKRRTIRIARFVQFPWCPVCAKEFWKEGGQDLRGPTPSRHKQFEHTQKCHHSQGLTVVPGSVSEGTSKNNPPCPLPPPQPARLPIGAGPAKCVWESSLSLRPGPIRKTRRPRAQTRGSCSRADCTSVRVCCWIGAQLLSNCWEQFP